MITPSTGDGNLNSDCNNIYENQRKSIKISENHLNGAYTYQLNATMRVLFSGMGRVLLWLTPHTMVKKNPPRGVFEGFRTLPHDGG